MMKINIPLSVKVFAYQYLATYLGISAACWRTLIFTLVNAISLGVCFFLSLYFVDSLGFDIKSVGLLMSCYGTGTVIGGIMSGKLCDQTSPEKIALLSLLAQGILFYSLVCFTTPLTLMLVLLLLGISTYCFKTANYIVMLSQCQGDAKMQLKVVNVSHAASNFGLGISGVMIGALANFGFHLIFYLAAGVIFLLTLYAAASTFRHSLLTMKQGENASLQTSSVSHDRNTKVLIHTLISVFAVGLIIAQLGSTYPVYIKEAFPELGTKAVSVLFILDTVLIVIFQAPLAHLYQHYNTLLVMGVGAFLMGVGMFVLSLSSTFMMAMLSCAIWTTGEMLFIPTAQLLCYQNAASRKKGQSLGIFQSSFALSAIIGPLMGGYLYGGTGPDTMWYISMIIGTACLLVSISIQEKKKNTHKQKSNNKLKAPPHGTRPDL